MVSLLERLDRGPARPRHPEKARLPDTPALKKPDWIRVRAPGARAFEETRAILRDHRLTTVCEEASCPNIGECWGRRHATFMILGDTCTRACAFCNVRTGKPGALDPDEPTRVATAVAALDLARGGDLGRSRQSCRQWGGAFPRHHWRHPRREASIRQSGFMRRRRAQIVLEAPTCSPQLVVPRSAGVFARHDYRVLGC
jgi:hypothetical protein